MFWADSLSKMYSISSMLESDNIFQPLQKSIHNGHLGNFITVCLVLSRDFCSATVEHDLPTLPAGHSSPRHVFRHFF